MLNISINIKQHKQERSAKEYIKGILKGNNVILSQAITLIESNNKKNHNLALEIINGCLPHSGNSIRIGITGVPGVGKSTFIEAFGKHLTSLKKKVAVLAIDPSSTINKGSILGDKTRMEKLSIDKRAFIRPSPSMGTLGGVAATTRESIMLCEAAGYNIIFIETIGVGQSEIAVHSMVDFFLLLMLSGAGDELQGIKRGIMEMADLIIINKADGDNIEKSSLAKQQYENSLHYFPSRTTGTGWSPKVELCSSQNKTGMERIWKIVLEHHQHFNKNGEFEKKRKEQSKYWTYETINEMLKNDFYKNRDVKSQLKKMEKQIANKEISTIAAANKLLAIYQSKKNTL